VKPGAAARFPAHGSLRGGLPGRVTWLMKRLVKRLLPSLLVASTVMLWLPAVVKSSRSGAATHTTPVVVSMSKRPPALSLKL